MQARVLFRITFEVRSTNAGLLSSSPIHSGVATQLSPLLSVHFEPTFTSGNGHKEGVTSDQVSVARLLLPHDVSGPPPPNPFVELPCSHVTDTTGGSTGGYSHFSTRHRHYTDIADPSRHIRHGHTHYALFTHHRHHTDILTLIHTIVRVPHHPSVFTPSSPDILSLLHTIVTTQRSSHIYTP